MSDQITLEVGQEVKLLIGYEIRQTAGSYFWYNHFCDLKVTEIIDFGDYYFPTEVKFAIGEEAFCRLTLRSLSYNGDTYTIRKDCRNTDNYLSSLVEYSYIEVRNESIEVRKEANGNKKYVRDAMEWLKRRANRGLRFSWE